MRLKPMVTPSEFCGLIAVVHKCFHFTVKPLTVDGEISGKGPYDSTMLEFHELF